MSFKFKVICLFLLILLGYRGFTQDVIKLEYEQKDLKKNKYISNDPGKLVNELTANKSGDKEKFDVIFAWVASNIRYNYRTYYSTNGVGKPDIKKVLKYKSGICLDYANLMDTLCKLADITNYTIYGYAKDDVFDVRDSLYIDNHAWNAVKLNGSWYVYDVTFASGKVEYKYKPFSKFIVKLINKFKIKYKKRTVKNKNFYSKKSVCSPEDYKNSEKELVYYQKKYRFNWLRRLLLKIKLKVVPDYKRYIDTNYYLCQPEVFAITHLPDNPVWSLTENRTITQFENDSAYYYLKDSVYKDQKRQGTTCVDCDNILAMEEFKYFENLKLKSTELNKKNKFISQLCEVNMSRIRYEESKKAEDSLTKVTLMDTSMVFLQQARTSLNKAYTDIDVDFGFQKTKNKTKLNSLLKDNNYHKAYFKKHVDLSYKEVKSFKSSVKKGSNSAKKYIHRSEALLKYKTQIASRKTNPDTIAVKEMDGMINKKIHEIDSLNTLISATRNEFDEQILILSAKLWKKVNEYDTIMLPFKERIYYRYFFSDDYKKLVVDVKKKIYDVENQYSFDTDSNIYAPVNKQLANYYEVLGLVEQREKKTDEYFQLKIQQVKSNMTSQPILQSYVNDLIEENQRDFCWLHSKVSEMLSPYIGFQALKSIQAQLGNVLKFENKQEKFRYTSINKELVRRQKKYKNIVVYNRRAVNNQLSEIKKQKREYLKTLKEERKAKNKKK